MMNGRLKAIESELMKCRQELTFLGTGATGVGAAVEGERKLIINTGDISDVDGFFALAQYAKTGADVLFIMNYPAFFNLKIDTPFKENEQGLGYEYGASVFLTATQQKFYNSFENYFWRYLLQTTCYKRLFDYPEWRIQRSVT